MADRLCNQQASRMHYLAPDLALARSIVACDSLIHLCSLTYRCDCHLDVIGLHHCCYCPVQLQRACQSEKRLTGSALFKSVSATFRCYAISLVFFYIGANKCISILPSCKCIFVPGGSLSATTVVLVVLLTWCCYQFSKKA